MSSENKSQPTIKGFFHKITKGHPSFQDAGIRRNVELSSTISLAMVVITLAATALTFHKLRYIQEII
jgi:hypothetical protein